MCKSTGINLIERKCFLLADGRTPADVREVQHKKEALLILMQVLAPLAWQVEDSIRQYQTELQVTVLNAEATASRVEGDADAALFVKEVKKQLAT